MNEERTTKKLLSLIISALMILSIGMVGVSSTVAAKDATNDTVTGTPLNATVNVIYNGAPYNGALYADQTFDNITVLLEDPITWNNTDVTLEFENTTKGFLNYNGAFQDNLTAVTNVNDTWSGEANATWLDVTPKTNSTINVLVNGTITNASLNVEQPEINITSVDPAEEDIYGGNFIDLTVNANYGVNSTIDNGEVNVTLPGLKSVDSNNETVPLHRNASFTDGSYTFEDLYTGQGGQEIIIEAEYNDTYDSRTLVVNELPSEDTTYVNTYVKKEGTTERVANASVYFQYNYTDSGANYTDRVKAPGVTDSDGELVFPLDLNGTADIRLWGYKNESTTELLTDGTYVKVNKTSSFAWSTYPGEGRIEPSSTTQQLNAPITTEDEYSASVTLPSNKTDYVWDGTWTVTNSSSRVSKEGAEGNYFKLKSEITGPNGIYDFDQAEDEGLDFGNLEMTIHNSDSSIASLYYNETVNGENNITVPINDGKVEFYANSTINGTEADISNKLGDFNITNEYSVNVTKDPDSDLADVSNESITVDGGTGNTTWANNTAGYLLEDAAYMSFQGTGMLNGEVTMGAEGVEGATVTALTYNGSAWTTETDFEGSDLVTSTGENGHFSIEVPASPDGTNYMVKAEYEDLTGYSTNETVYAGLTTSVGVGWATEGNFTLSNLQVDPQEGGSPFNTTVNATITNNADSSDAYNAELYFDGDLVGSKSVAVSGNDEEVVSFEYEVSEAPGDYNVTIDGLAPKTVTVLEPANFTVGNLTVVPDSGATPFEVNATVPVTNEGEAKGAYSAELFVNGTEVGNETGTILGNTTEDVTIPYEFNETYDVGTYNVTMNITGTEEYERGPEEVDVFESGTLSGIVTDEGDKAVPGATIKVQKYNGTDWVDATGFDDELIKTESSSDGTYRIADIPTLNANHTQEDGPDYKAVAELGGQSGQSVVFQIYADATQTANIDMSGEFEELAYSDLVVEPQEGEASLNVTVNATVTNGGDFDLTEDVILYVDGNNEASKSVSVDAGEGKTVSFDYTFVDAGTYDVTIDDLTAEQVNVTSPNTTKTVEEAIAGDDGEVDDQEILDAIDYWSSGEEVPDTGGETIGDTEILDLIDIWSTS